MYVVPARMHDRHLTAFIIDADCRTCVVQPGGLLDGQRVHVGTKHHHGSGAIVQTPTTPVFPRSGGPEAPSPQGVR